MYIQTNMTGSLSHKRLLYGLIYDEIKKNHLENAEMMNDILKKSRITIGHINLVEKIMYNSTDNLENLKDLLSMITEKYNNQTLSDNKKTLSDNKKILLDNKKTLSDNKKTLSDNKKILLDNKKTLSDNKKTLFDNKNNFKKRSQV
ncbi:phd finger protein [Tupanvirus soda lake]|uniref:Phd finger protein n=2 Tax=Tupanvirus TaxID=2094720 RepID=A0A6N1NMZ9_9VIRU|nr:phd finger protein [Tupanvirus soda lake]QKU35759.1 phd finger protein [Tupanvirus soda lake]